MQLTAMIASVPGCHEGFPLPGEGMTLHTQQDSARVFPQLLTELRERENETGNTTTDPTSHKLPASAVPKHPK